MKDGNNNEVGQYLLSDREFAGRMVNGDFVLLPLTNEAFQDFRIPGVTGPALVEFYHATFDCSGTRYLRADPSAAPTMNRLAIIRGQGAVYPLNEPPVTIMLFSRERYPGVSDSNPSGSDLLTGAGAYCRTEGIPAPVDVRRASGIIDLTGFAPPFRVAAR